jgi:hypothetical protein
MITDDQAQSPREWARKHFSAAELSDVRRQERVITIAEAMAASPGAGLPQMFAHPYDLKAAYGLFAHPEATPDNLQAGHRELVLCEMERPGRYLLLEDTSEVLCTKGQEIIGLGPVGSAKEAQIGFHLHSVLALRWPSSPDTLPPHKPTVEMLGLADQQFHVRQPRSAKAGSRAGSRRLCPAEELESSLWEKASRRLGVAPKEKPVSWIKVGDRGADIYDHLRECQRQGQRFIIRANQSRVLVAADAKPVGKLFEKVRASQSCGKIELELRGRAGQASRRAGLQVSYTPVRLRAPQVRGEGAGVRPALPCLAIRVWEEQAPPGIKALEWILLTDLEVENFAPACEVAQMYASRWLVEEFHKALKTGMDAEGLQLTKAKPWFAAVALMSIVALRLIGLRETMRRRPEAEAEAAGMSELELAVLRARSGKELKSVKEVALAIGRLGGHLNRQSDGPPGWITLWRGWKILQTLVEGVQLARKLTGFG